MVTYSVNYVYNEDDEEQPYTIITTNVNTTPTPIDHQPSHLDASKWQ